MTIDWIKDPKGALKHYSTIALGFATFVQGAWIAMPESMKAGFPSQVNEAVSWVTFAIVMAGLFGKFINQPVDEPPVIIKP